MKEIILLALILTTSVPAITTDGKRMTGKEIECDTVMRMLDLSMKQGRPITGDQLITVINACKDIERFKEFVADVQHILDTTSEDQSGSKR